MAYDLDVAGNAIAEFDAEQYSTAVQFLVLPSQHQSQKNKYNTIFSKEAVKADSFDIFSTIRRTAFQNAYFHVPFCRTECLYCSYEKILGTSDDLIKKYLAALRSEIRRKQAILKDDLRPDIFYVGGGTPTVLPLRAMHPVFQLLAQSFDLKKNLEFTVETTPQAILDRDGMDKLTLMKESGVNRINVGVQSFSEGVARMNGRSQSKDDIIQCFERLRAVGFSKINLDLMYGIVGQTLDVWQSDLLSAVELGPDSITTFALRVRPPSRLHVLVSRGQAALPSQRDVLTMRIMAQHYLPERGYSEDSSDYFIKSADKRYLYQPFHPHNINRNLIGFGPSAYSLAGDKQIINVTATREYIRISERAADPIDSVITLSRQEYVRKRFAEGLRTAFDGLSFQREFGFSIFDTLPGIIHKLREGKLIVVDGHSITLSFKGKILHDFVAEHIKYSDSS